MMDFKPLSEMPNTDAASGILAALAIILIGLSLILSSCA